MKRTGYIPEQIAFAFRQAQGDTRVVVCRKMGMAE